MKRIAIAVACVVAAGVVVFQSAAAGPGNVTCSGVFTGTAKDLTVPANGDCTLDGATITHDVIVGANGGVGAFNNTTIGHDLRGGAFLEGVTIGHDLILPPNGGLGAVNTTIGHDLRGTRLSEVTLGTFECGPPDCPNGPVKVGHDIVLSGSAPNARTYEICDTTVGHDLRITDTVTGPRTFTSGNIEIGDIAGPDEFTACSVARSAQNEVGHDLVVTGNQVGFAGDSVPSSIDVGDNSVGHNLVVSDNSAPAAGGYIDVSDNNVGHDALCSANTPALSKDGSEDGPNQAGHSNSCG